MKLKSRLRRCRDWKATVAMPHSRENNYKQLLSAGGILTLMKLNRWKWHQNPHRRKKFHRYNSLLIHRSLALMSMEIHTFPHKKIMQDSVTHLPPQWHEQKTRNNIPNCRNLVIVSNTSRISQQRLLTWNFRCENSFARCVRIGNWNDRSGGKRNLGASLHFLLHRSSSSVWKEKRVPPFLQMYRFRRLGYVRSTVVFILSRNPDGSVKVRRVRQVW